MEFQQRLKMLRKERGITQADLAKLLTYGATAISNYEAGHNQPSISDLKKIASIFDVSLDYLLGVTEVRMGYGVSEFSYEKAEVMNYYDMLDEDSRQEVLHYIRFLLNRKENSDPYSENGQGQKRVLKVAQKPDDFTV